MFRIREGDLDSASPADNFTDPDLRRELYYHLSQGGDVHDLEVELPGADQASIWALLTSNPVNYELEESSLFWFYDITERKRAECPSSKQMGLLSVFHKGGSGSSLFDVKPLGVDGSSGGFGWSVF